MAGATHLVRFAPRLSPWLSHLGFLAQREARAKPAAGQESEVAPGGVEPPHTDSKSVALSTELRGLG